MEDAPAAQDSNVVDLTELLRRSLGGGHKAAAPREDDGKPAARTSRKRPAKTAAKHAAPRKRSAPAAKRTAAKSPRARRAA